MTSRNHLGLLPSVPPAAAGAPQRGGAGEGCPEGEQREADQQVGGRLTHTLHDNRDDVNSSLIVVLTSSVFVCLQRLRCVPTTEMASSRAAVEVTDRPAGDGAEGRPGGQKRDPGQDQG